MCRRTSRRNVALLTDDLKVGSLGHVALREGDLVAPGLPRLGDHIGVGHGAPEVSVGLIVGPVVPRHLLLGHAQAELRDVRPCAVAAAVRDGPGRTMLAASTMQNHERHIEEHLLRAFEELAIADIMRPTSPRGASRRDSEAARSSPLILPGRPPDADQGWVSVG
jgi:hypothetical protein